MKILQINKFYYLKGGSEKHFFELIDMLEEKGHEVIVFSTENKKNFEKNKNAYFTKKIKMSLKNFKDGFNLFYNRNAIKELKKIISENRPDIAHLHNISHHFSPAILKVFKKYNIPVVMTVHDYKLICPNYKLFNNGKNCEKCSRGKYYKCTLNKCVKDSYLGSLVMTMEAYWAKWMKYYDYIDIFIAPSYFMRNKLIENGYDSKKVKYIPNFLGEKAEENIPNSAIKNEKYFLFFGRLSMEKGIDTLIQSLPLADLKNYKLKIVGSGPEENKLKELAKNLKLENKIEFVGYQSGKNLENLISEAKFIIIPSMWYENAPYSVLESYNAEKAVIGSRMGGIPEMMLENKTGLIFEAGNRKELAGKINYLVAHPEKTIQMGMAGKKYLDEKFNREKYYNRLVKIYREL